MLRHSIIITAALLFSGVLGAAVNTVRTDVRDLAWVRPEEKLATISTGDLFLALHSGGVWLVDARPAEQFAEGHLAGAVNLPAERRFELLEAVAGVIPLHERVVCYCASAECDAGDEVAATLKGLAYEQVLVFKPGWHEVEAMTAFSPFIERGTSQ